MRTIAVVPARGGSRGLPGKNVKKILDRSLLERAIDFGLHLGLDDVIVTTDNEEYASVAIHAGATVLGLRSAKASTSTAMEPAVIDDLNLRFLEFGYERPGIAVWIRPTFVFRSVGATRTCIDLVSKRGMSAGRVVTEVDPRLYMEKSGRLVPMFDDHGVSMMRRQDLTPCFHVFNVDVFRWPIGQCPDNYLGSDVGFSLAPKLCGVDIDTPEDLQIAEALISSFGTGILP